MRQNTDLKSKRRNLGIKQPMLFWLSSEEYTWMPDAHGQKPFMTCWTIKCHFHYNLAIKSDFISILSRFHFRPNSVNLKFLSFSITHNLGIGKRYAQTWGKLATPWKNPCYWRSEGPRYIQHLWLLIPLCPTRYGFATSASLPQPLLLRATAGDFRTFGKERCERKFCWSILA